MHCPASFLALLSALSVWPGAGLPSTILLDERHQAHTFDGIGALSAGASSRLLWDYDEGARGRILDLLFKPNYGASLQILKVEIGGDTQSTDGAEASHEHEEGDLDCSRGYELWLLREAKRRNPDILTYGLSWGLPGWVGNETFFSADNIKYQVDWAKCMKEEAGVDLNYLGIWNERPWGNEDYTLQLRSALDGAGFGATELVMLDGGTDSPGFFEAMDSNASFRSAFSAVGLHYPCNEPLPSVLRHGKRLWASEEASVPATWGGAGCWGRVLNQNYVRMNMTASIMWALVWSAYPNLDCFGNGMLYAFQPWSGRFSVNAPVWVTAHTTQFVKPGWRYLRPGSGLLPEGGTFVSMVDGLGNVTLILETLLGSCMYHSGCPHDLRPSRSQRLTFRLGATLRSERLAVWLTNQTHHFLRLADAEVDESGLFEVEMPPDAVITLTSPGNSNRQSKAGGDDLPPPSESGETSPFPLPYSETFEDYPGSLTGSIAKYFADQSGAWEAGGGVLRQVVTRPPGRNQWSCNSEPFTQVGDVNWTSYAASVRARMPEEEAGAAGAGYVALCVRVARYAGFKCGGVPGHCLRLNRSGWILSSAGPDAAAAGSSNVLASGREVALTSSNWSTLELHARGTLIEVLVDGKSLASVRSTASFLGQVVLGSGWHRAEFDDLSVRGLPPAPTPAPGSTALKRLSLWTRDWGQLTCDPAPRTAGREPRSDYSGYVGMRLRVRQPVTVTALGRWRSDGDLRSHALVLAGEDFRVRADLQPDMPPEDTGFAWAEVQEVALQPGLYDILSEESAGGDQWLDEGVILEEEDWVEVLASVYGPSPEALRTSSPHTSYGPVGLRVRGGGAALRSLGAAGGAPTAQAGSSHSLGWWALPASLLAGLLAGAPLALSKGRIFRRGEAPWAGPRRC